MLRITGRRVWFRATTMRVFMTVYLQGPVCGCCGRVRVCERARLRGACSDQFASRSRTFTDVHGAGAAGRAAVTSCFDGIRVEVRMPVCDSVRAVCPVQRDERGQRASAAPLPCVVPDLAPAVDTSAGVAVNEWGRFFAVVGTRRADPGRGCAACNSMRMFERVCDGTRRCSEGCFSGRTHARMYLYHCALSTHICAPGRPDKCDLASTTRQFSFTG